MDFRIWDQGAKGLLHVPLSGLRACVCNYIIYNRIILSTNLCLLYLDQARRLPHRHGGSFRDQRCQCILDLMLSDMPGEVSRVRALRTVTQREVAQNRHAQAQTSPNQKLNKAATPRPSTLLRSTGVLACVCEAQAALQFSGCEFKFEAKITRKPNARCEKQEIQKSGRNSPGTVFLRSWTADSVPSDRQARAGLVHLVCIDPTQRLGAPPPAAQL